MASNEYALPFEVAGHLAATITERFDGDDVFPRVSTWPRYFQRLFLKHHKGFQERTHLFMFLWTNGMEPRRARFWVMWHGINGYKHVPAGYRHTQAYDKSAWRAINDLAHKAEHRPQYFTNWHVYNLNERRVI